MKKIVIILVILFLGFVSLPAEAGSKKNSIKLKGSFSEDENRTYTAIYYRHFKGKKLGLGYSLKDKPKGEDIGSFIVEYIFSF